MKIVNTKKGRMIKETVTGYLCIAPMLLALFVFTFYPIFSSNTYEIEREIEKAAAKRYGFS